MITKQKERERAIKLRRKGRTYSEILAQIPVAKSTLSLWLREVGIAQKQKQRLTQKKREASFRGGEARRRQRVEETRAILNQAEKEIGAISKRELWLIGSALYWAEGSKQKISNVAQQTQFSNSDSRMIEIFMTWLQDVIKIPR